MLKDEDAGNIQRSGVDVSLMQSPNSLYGGCTVPSITVRVSSPPYNFTTITSRFEILLIIGHSPYRASEDESNTGKVIPLELLHKVSPNSPHSGSLPVYVHRYSGRQTSQLNPSNG